MCFLAITVRHVGRVLETCHSLACSLICVNKTVNPDLLVWKTQPAVEHHPVRRTSTSTRQQLREAFWTFGDTSPNMQGTHLTCPAKTERHTHNLLCGCTNPNKNCDWVSIIEEDPFKKNIRYPQQNATDWSWDTNSQSSPGLVGKELQQPSQPHSGGRMCALGCLAVGSG